MTWEFITKPVHSTNAVSWEWEWRYIDDGAVEKRRTRTFTSFKECIADARLHGFTGRSGTRASRARSSSGREAALQTGIERGAYEHESRRASETAISPIDARSSPRSSAGRMVVLVDEEDRENEGDLLIAAEFATRRSDQLHGALRPRSHLPHAHRGALPAVESAADGDATTARRSARTSPSRSKPRKA